MPLAPFRVTVPWLTFKVPSAVEAWLEPARRVLLLMVIVPTPILVRLKLVLFWLALPKTPENVKLVVGVVSEPKPVDRTTDPALLVTRPVPVIDLVTTVVPARSKVAPAARATSE